MSVHTHISPRPGFEPSGEINPAVGMDGVQRGNPFAVLTVEENGTYIGLGALSDDAAVAYLDALADACTDLATRIRVAQRQSALLAAVQQTPHDPEQAAAIRARYADEATAEVQ
jgi:hypothetical protein